MLYDLYNIAKYVLAIIVAIYGMREAKMAGNQILSHIKLKNSKSHNDNADKSSYMSMKQMYCTSLLQDIP